MSPVGRSGPVGPVRSRNHTVLKVNGDLRSQLWKQFEAADSALPSSTQRLGTPRMQSALSRTSLVKAIEQVRRLSGASKRPQVAPAPPKHLPINAEYVEMIMHTSFSASTCGLVAMTSASHAEGRQFDPGQVFFIFSFFSKSHVSDELDAKKHHLTPIASFSCCKSSAFTAPLLHVTTVNKNCSPFFVQSVPFG